MNVELEVYLACSMTIPKSPRALKSPYSPTERHQEIELIGLYECVRGSD